MAVTLEIHHIGLRNRGDSTLLVARGSTTPWAVLVDGGLREESGSITQYIRQQVSEKPLTALICTHYDADHTDGLVRVLQNAAIVDPSTTLVIDRGVPVNANGSGIVARTRKRTSNNEVLPYFTYSKCDRPFKTEYHERVVRITSALPGYSRDPLKRVTAAVNPANGFQKGGLYAFKGKTSFNQDGFELMGWILSNQSTFDLSTFTDPRISLTFVVANSQILTTGAAGERAVQSVPLAYHPELRGEELLGSLENQRSLGFIVTFGNFVYYCAGDLESTQEDQLITPPGFLAGKTVHAAKFSHHGSKYSTSERFLMATKPTVGFISNGLNNIYGHPSRDFLARLERSNKLATYFISGWYYGRNMHGHPPLSDVRRSYPRARVAGVRSTSDFPAQAGTVVLSIDATGARARLPSFRVQYHDASENKDVSMRFTATG